MPELPEVETIVRGLRGPLIGQKVTGVNVGFYTSAMSIKGRTLCQRFHIDHLCRSINDLATPTAEEFKRRLVGQEIFDVKRRGKYIVCQLSGGGALIFHLRMTGRLQVVPANRPLDKHDYLVFSLDDGNELRFNNVRKLGRIYLVDNEKKVIGKLGPEPLAEEFALHDFAALFDGRRGMIKPLLLNQGFIAGIGNIYTNEALFAARIHPKRKADTLTNEEIERLYHAIRDVLRQGIENRGTTLRYYRDGQGREGRNQYYLQVYGRAGQPCPRCGTSIEHTVLSGRGTYFCQKCQRK